MSPKFDRIHLAYNSKTLSEFLDPAEIPIVAVAILPNGNVEFDLPEEENGSSISSISRNMA
jgi:hypothetical protein